MIYFCIILYFGILSSAFDSFWHQPMIIKKGDNITCIVPETIDCVWHVDLYDGDDDTFFDSDLSNKKECIFKIYNWMTSINKKYALVQCSMTGNGVRILVKVLAYLETDISIDYFDHCASKNIYFNDYFNKTDNVPHICLMNGRYERMNRLTQLSFPPIYIFYIKNIENFLIVLPVLKFGMNITIKQSLGSPEINHYIKHFRDYWILVNVRNMISDNMDIFVVNVMYGRNQGISLLLHISEDIKSRFSQSQNKLNKKTENSEIILSKILRYKYKRSGDTFDGLYDMVNGSAANDTKDSYILIMKCYIDKCQYKFGPLYQIDSERNKSLTNVTDKSITISFSTKNLQTFTHSDPSSVISRFSRLIYFSFTGSIILIIISLLIIVINCIKKKRILCYGKKSSSMNSIIWMTNEKYGIHDCLLPPYTQMPLSHIPNKVNMSNCEQITQCSILSNESESICIPNYSTIDFENSTNTYNKNSFPRFFGDISELNIKLKFCIGSGAFGKVFLGEIFYLNKDRQKVNCDIAAKEIMQTEDTTSTLFSEMSLMKSIGYHANIVTLIGYCKRENLTDLLIMEFCSKGSLKAYLNHLYERDLSPLLIFKKFSYEIALGMEYLSSKNVIHRDLAARNVLLSEEYVCKISDFGMSRQLPVNESYYRHIHGVVPLKWMAPEVLVQHKYSTQADVWSYGILLWEIFSIGANPYENFPMNQVTDLVNHGYRMPIPVRCPSEIVKLIKNCWNFEPSLRPTFKDIVKDF